MHCKWQEQMDIRCNLTRPIKQGGNSSCVKQKSLKLGLLIKLNVPRDAIYCPGELTKIKLCEIRGAETSTGLRIIPSVE